MRQEKQRKNYFLKENPLFMNQLSKIFFILLFSSMLFGSNVEIFQNKIEKFFKESKEQELITSTYSVQDGLVEYQGIRVSSTPYMLPLWQTIQVFDNIEHNSSQRALKEQLEKLIPYYLKAKLFSKEQIKSKFSQEGMAFKYENFFRLLDVYLLYLEKIDKDSYYKLIDKMLDDFTSLMKNSNNFMDYMLSIKYLSELFENLAPSEELTKLLNRYPLLNQEIFFEKLKQEKEQRLTMWKESKQEGIEELGFSKKGFAKFKSKITLKCEKILNKAYQLEAIAIKDGSEKSWQNYRNYINAVSDMERHRTLFNAFKYQMSIYIIKGLNFLGIESDFRGTTTEVMLSLLCRLMLSPAIIHQKTYQEHNALLLKYEKLRGE